MEHSNSRTKANQLHIPQGLLRWKIKSTLSNLQ